MEQLLSMGFSNELATEALAATGGKSTLEATEWILNHSTSSPNSDPSPSPSPTPHQPKLDRFFQFHPKPSTAATNPPPSSHGQDKEEDFPLSKRLKLLQTPPPISVLSPATGKPPHEPLAERMRPRTIDDIVGQDHLLSDKSLLRSAIQCNRLPSIIFWGPPGTGKTSLAKAIVGSSSQRSLYRLTSLSAVTSGVKDVRDAVDDAKKWRMKNNKITVLFVDEVHRFNKSQQDSFLPVIEDGSIVFVGATTENPSFHLITPLLSRCRVLTLKPLKPEHIATLLRRAIEDKQKGLSLSMEYSNIQVSEDGVEFLSGNCDGDARVALNALEISATTAAARMVITKEGNSANVTLDDVKEALQCKHIAYDKAGEEHYNLISALHKSMRGSDADAAIYWLARMLEGGEEPLYIARRLVRFASEDVGLADPAALHQSVACYQACHFLGMPECNVILAQCVAYLSLAPKSVAVYKALGSAQKVVRESVGQNEGVPLHLRNAPTKLMKDIGYGEGYIYPPDNPDSVQSYLPPSLEGHQFLDWPGS